MNRTEQKAHLWLTQNGKAVRFQHGRSPDFIDEQGHGYEVKLLGKGAGKGHISFSNRQVEHLRSVGKATILVFNGGDAPVAQIPSPQLEVPSIWQGIHLQMISSTIAVSKETYQALLALMVPRENYSQAVGRLLTELVQARASLQRKRRRQNAKPQQAGE